MPKKPPKKPSKPIVMSPLADPVVGAIFSDVNNAGLAAASLVGAVLIKDGRKMGRVVSVTPQRYYKNPSERGCRIDVEVTTDANERIIVEVQLLLDLYMFQRNLFAASRIFSASSHPGTDPAQMAAELPFVIAINIMDFNVREDHADYFQPVQLLYTKPPHRVAIPQWAVYNIQLSRFREHAPDFNDALDCWLYAMDEANQKNLTIQEVIDMTPELQTFMNNDKGFQQYCAQYHRVASDPIIQDEYYRWLNEQMRQQGMIAAAKKEGEQIGRKAGWSDMITVLNELGVSPDILRQAETKLDASTQN